MLTQRHRFVAHPASRGWRHFLHTRFSGSATLRAFVCGTGDERARFALVRTKTKRMQEDRRSLRLCCRYGAPLFVSSRVTHCVFSLSILHALRVQSHNLRQIPRITRSYVVELTRVSKSTQTLPNWHSSCSYWPVRVVETLRSRASRGSNSSKQSLRPRIMS